MAFSRDGARLASVGAGDMTIVWDAATGAELRRFPRGGFRAAFSRDEGATWTAIDATNYWSVGAASPSAAWAVGANGRITKLSGF